MGLQRGKLGNKRSNRWPSVRANHLQRQPVCQACGGKKKLQVHHMRPFEYHPDLDLTESNLITLCEDPSRNCHFHHGHALDWKAFNPHVAQDARQFLQRIKRRKYGVKPGLGTMP